MENVLDILFGLVALLPAAFAVHPLGDAVGLATHYKDCLASG